AARDDMHAVGRDTEGADDVLKICLRDRDYRARGGRALGQVRWRLVVDVVPVRGERERNAHFRGQLSRRGGRRGREMGMDQTRPELSEHDPKLVRVVHREVVEAGASNDLVAQIFYWPSQGQDTHLNTAPAHLGQLGRDERL